MTEAEIEKQLRELAGKVELKDVLSAPKEHKTVNIDSRKLEVEAAEKLIAKNKQEKYNQSILSEARQLSDPNFEEEEEFDEEEFEEEEFDDLNKVSPEMSAETYFIYYKLGLKVIDYALPAADVELMDEEEKDLAEYLKQFDRKDLDSKEQTLVGKYLRLEKVKSESKSTALTPDEEIAAKEAISVVCRKRKWQASPEVAAITVLGEQIGARILSRIM